MSFISAPGTIVSEDYEKNKIQDNITKSIGEIIKQPILNGVLLENIVLKSGRNNLVPHKLNRKWVGYIVVFANKSMSPYCGQVDKSADRNVYLHLQHDNASDVTCSLWVF